MITAKLWAPPLLPPCRRNQRVAIKPQESAAFAPATLSRILRQRACKYNSSCIRAGITKPLICKANTEGEGLGKDWERSLDSLRLRDLNRFHLSRVSRSDILGIGCRVVSQGSALARDEAKRCCSTASSRKRRPRQGHASEA